MAKTDKTKQADPEWEAVMKGAKKINKLSREERHKMLLELEAHTDIEWAARRITQEEAWDRYFGLLHECDESEFLVDRPRILGKIDTQRYNPLVSKDPTVVMLAKMRLTQPPRHH